MQPYIVSTNGKQNGQHLIPASPVPDKLQPHNVEAEEAVLGSLLIDPDATLLVCTFLLKDDFYVERHGWIYEAIKHLHEKNIPTDLVTISDELDRRKQLDGAGGAVYFTDLINRTPTAIHIEHYAKIVHNTGKLRRLINAAGQIARLAYKDAEDADAVIDQAQEIIFGVSSKQESKTKPAIEAVDKLLTRTEYLRSNENKLVGIPTGLTDLDRLLGGLQRSDMIIIAGRPGMGKTSLALSIALNATLKWRLKIGIFSLEMSDEQLVQRLVSADSGIDSQRIRLGNIKDDEWPAFIQSSNRIAESNIHLNDTPAISVREIRTEARKLQASYGLDLLIVDYLQLMRGDSRSENRQQEISYISRSIKALAKELNIPILALSQLNRSCESRTDKRPMLSDLRESGSLEQDTDAVIFVYRDEVYHSDTECPNVAELILAKHRNGPTGNFSVYFKKHLAQFMDLEIRRQSLDYAEPEVYRG